MTSSDCTRYPNVSVPIPQVAPITPVRWALPAGVVGRMLVFTFCLAFWALVIGSLVG